MIEVMKDGKKIKLQNCPKCGKEPFLIKDSGRQDLKRYVKCKNGDCSQWHHLYFISDWNRLRFAPSPEPLVKLNILELGGEEEIKYINIIKDGDVVEYQPWMETNYEDRR